MNSGKELLDSLPKKMSISPNVQKTFESAEEGGTLMGRLAARMASRDMIDELDLGPKGRSPEAKKAQIADASDTEPQIADDSDTEPQIADASEIEKETEEHPSLPKKTIKKIVKDHETANLEDTVPSKLFIGAGLHEQTKDLDSKKDLDIKKDSNFNMNDPIIENKVRKGNNMAEQAKAAGNVYDTMHDVETNQQKSLKNAEKRRIT